jgi:hypothetical protein
MKIYLFIYGMHTADKSRAQGMFRDPNVMNSIGLDQFSQQSRPNTFAWKQKQWRGLFFEFQSCTGI